MAKVEKDINVSEVIRRRRYDLYMKNEYKSLLIRIIILLVIGWLLLTQVFMLTQANGMGMFPALKDGDLVFAYRLQKDYQKDDVVVYTHEDELYIGRIVARENDIVTMDDTGTLLISGTLQSGEILYPTYAKEGITYPYRVPDKNVFILGDYRTNAEDSRDFGSINMEHVKGKVITILRRRGL